MTGADVITVVVCVFFGASALSLAFAQPLGKLRARRRARVAEVNAVLASPIKLPVTRASRAARTSYARLLKNTDPVQVAREAERFAPELAEALADIGELARFDVKDADR